MGKHVIADGIADGINAGNAGFKVLIDLDKALFHGNADLVKAKTFGIGRTANSHEHQIDFLLLIAEGHELLAALVLGVDEPDRPLGRIGVMSSRAGLLAT